METVNFLDNFHNLRDFLILEDNLNKNCRSFEEFVKMICKSKQSQYRVHKMLRVGLKLN